MGFCQPGKPGPFRRLPEETAEAAGRRVRLLGTNTAGGRICFQTDSSFLALGAVYFDAEIPSARTAAFCGAGAFCFDLYADGRHVRVLWPDGCRQNGPNAFFDLADGRYEAYHDFGSGQQRKITICFPSFANIKDVYVGLEEGSVLSMWTPCQAEDPVVFYGSSITQGACASRPGNTYPNILSRRLGFDYLNLGFASAAKAQPSVIDYLCQIPMSVLVFDYDHNAPSAEFLESTHYPALHRLRQAHPGVPFLVLSRPDLDSGEEDVLKRIEVIRESCRRVGEESDAPVRFVNAYEIFLKYDPEMMTVDGTHPTDLGFYAIADALEDPLRRFLSN
ncbi:MAG: hypothetical protein II719_07625 [Clostridia bacterium]|nr:hypothetical protein [Clostridia bacterium]